jgi:membrane protein
MPHAVRVQAAIERRVPTLSSSRFGTVVRRAQATFIGRCVRGFVDLEGFDRALVISSQALTAIIPLLMLVSTLLPADQNDYIAQKIIQRFRLEGSAANAVEALFTRPESAVTQLSAFGLLLVLYSGVSFTRRMQRMYQRAWGLRPMGVRSPLNAALGLAALLFEIGLLSLIRTIVAGLPATGLLQLATSFATGVVLWTSIPWLLLDRRVHWRRLVPVGVLAAVGSSIYSVATAVYMPQLIEDYSARYGLFGVTLALVGWLLCIAVVIVTATVIGAELDRTQDPWARRVKAWFGADQLQPAPPIDPSPDQL